ncbi:hypothetical protein J1P26_21650 [Neobacillus sp. MM2021_6]|uniref:hypothetical protein n=1 Tax=Bacillaceae TaxID=186817 RepID=UPI00140E75ED|nr:MULTISPECIES: hypothetical protein [Bacillaceae]MBO0962311.1 hypothetical protein [Neobacillus sp. MM2021_6]NHC20792.1 hypothetical protein [Bacillus sp. MM2020_4]
MAEIEKNATYLELLWDQTFQQVDSWVQQAEFHEDILLQYATNFAEKVKRNDKNSKELTEHLSEKVREWEKASREELLTTTTALKNLFPTKSYEEINKQFDDIQNKTAEFTLTPFTYLANGEQVDKVVHALEQYVEFRRTNRNLFVKNVKEAASIIRENQNVLLDLMTKQVKNIFFPFQQLYTVQTHSLKSKTNQQGD